MLFKIFGFFNSLYWSNGLLCKSFNILIYQIGGSSSLLLLMRAIPVGR